LNKDPYYVTTPIYYVNDKPHIGHAYTTLACDVLARFHRLEGDEVYFLTGTDEHGQKVQKSAQAAGVDPQSFTDEVSENFRVLAKDMNYSNDDFIRTTEDRHFVSTQDLWRKIRDNGHIYLSSYSGWYAIRDEAFYSEKELITNEKGKKIAPTGAEVEWVEEPSYFFDLSKWQQPLLDFYQANENFIGPASRRNEVISFVSSGLNDLSISRTSFKWGIPVPDDPDHIMYVWLDALNNYQTAIGYPSTSDDKYNKYWPADLHMVGKDILRFHAVYWPAFLLAAGLMPPKRIFAHGWLLNRGEKMSKSLGNVVSADDLVKRYGLDPVRYYLLREVPFGQDGYISHETLVGRINSDLANDLGNLVQRVLSMINKYCDGKVPNHQQLESQDLQIITSASDVLEVLRNEFNSQAFHKGLEAIWRIISDANKYVDSEAPWKLKKTNPERMNTVLYVLTEVIRRIAIILQPIMPDSSSRILDQLVIPINEREFTHLTDSTLSVGIKLPKPEPVFPRYIENE